MGEELVDTMNLDLNLGPDPESDLQPISTQTVNLADWSNERSSESVTRIRTRHRTRFRQLNLPIPVIELNQLMGSSASLQTGEGSERVDEDLKICGNNGDGATGDNVSDQKGDVERINGGESSFFDCNICLDLSKEPVLTCCGHLYCWPCLYQWLQVSEGKECPVCKGEVTSKTVTPIYGRGNHKRELEESLDSKIPMRPQAKRVENLRNTIQRSSFTIPMEEMIRRIQSRSDFTNREAVEDRANSILNRLMTSRGVRSDQNQTLPPSESISLDLEETPARFHPVLIRRQLQSHRVARISTFTSGLSSVDAYIRTHPLARNHQEHNYNSPAVIDDRDSFSSIAAVINSESQVDTAVEIDSMVTLSTSSSRRRNENGSRVSDVDSADSRPLRRRRFT